MAISVSAIKQAIIEYKGNVTKVAESFESPRSTIASRIAKSDTLKKTLRDARDARNDSVRDTLYEQAVDKKNVTALIFIAKTQMGWTEKQHIEHSGGVSFSQAVEAVRNAEEQSVNTE